MQILLRLYYLSEVPLEGELHLVVLVIWMLCSVVLSRGSGAPDFQLVPDAPAVLRLGPVLQAPRSFYKALRARLYSKTVTQSLLGELKVLVNRESCPGGSQMK